MTRSTRILVDGDEYVLYEPRLLDYIRSQNAPEGVARTVAMLTGMLRRTDGTEFTKEQVEDLPLRVFDALMSGMDELRSRPLDENGSLFSGSPSVSVAQ